MSEVLFDLSNEYEEMLNRGIRLSGENRDYFIHGRLKSLSRRLPQPFSAKRILDFGCGIGTTSFHLSNAFDGAEVVGVDTSANAVAHATTQYGSERVRFRMLEELASEGEFDLCYVNGVFHHIEPDQRVDAARGIYQALRRGGRLALFENNPWNPGARMVMRRIPFDRDAKPFPPPEAVRLVRQSGFEAQPTTWSLFYFPRALAFLRFTENVLEQLPLGAQYCVLAVK